MDNDFDAPPDPEIPEIPIEPIEPLKNFVDPETIHVPLSNGGWVKIKKYLNIFDQRRAESAGVVYVRVEDVDENGHKIKTIVDRIDWSLYEIARAEIWLVRWSLLDSKGEPRALNIDSIKALNPDIFDEITVAIFKRVSEIADEKKRRRAAILRASGLKVPDDQTSS